MHNPPEDHEIPEDKPEGNESFEKREDFAAYQQAGGSLSVVDFQKVLDTTSSVKQIHLAEQAGIMHEFKKIWATSIIGAFGRPFVAEKGMQWLREEADALYAMQKREQVSASKEVVDTVSSVATEAHDKIVTPEPQDFEKYQQYKGTLDPETFTNVLNARFTPDVYTSVIEKMLKFEGRKFHDNAYVMAAKLETALKGDSRLEQRYFFMQESFALVQSQS